MMIQQPLMTVRELLAMLQEASPDAVVILACDEEGNNFSPLANVDTDSRYAPETRSSGEVRLARLTPELEAQGFSEDDAGGEDSLPCICLWPLA